MNKIFKPNKQIIILPTAVILLILLFSNVYAQSFTTDSENLREELDQRVLPDVTRAYHEKVKVFDAWNAIKEAVQEGDLVLSPVTIGIIDTGVDVRDDIHPEFPDVHPEFKDVNFGRSSPFSLRDRAPREFINPSEAGHGTQVAGIIGANNISAPTPSNYMFPHMNGIIAGVTDDYILELRHKDVTTIASFSQVIQNIPQDSIVNISFGSSMCSKVNNADGCTKDSRFEEIRDFYFEGVNKRTDILFVMAAGNDGIDAQYFLPGGGVNHINTIAVAAVTLDDERALFVGGGSNHTTVDIAAPGVNIYAPSIRNKGDADLDVAEEVNYTSTFSGSSAAAPFVTGVAALLKSIDPTLSPLQIKNRILANADPIETGEADKTLGNRCRLDLDPINTGCRLNAFRAVVRVLPIKITDVAPDSGAQDQTLDVIITGKNFSPDVMSADFGEGITVNEIEVLSNETLKATITISPPTAVGTRDVTITKAEGGPAESSKTLDDAFTVTSATPPSPPISCPLSGSVFSDATIPLSESPCVIQGSLTIASGATLTIDPGVVVKFAFTNSQIVVNGALNANGTPSQPIFFTSIKDDTVGGDTNNDGASTFPAPADWHRIFISDSGTGIFTNTTIRYGGKFLTGAPNPVRAGIVSEGTLFVTNSHLTQNESANMRVLDGTAAILSSEFDTSSVGISHVGGSVTVSQSSIHDHTLFGISAGGPANLTLTDTDFQSNFRALQLTPAVNFIHSGNTATNNGINGIVMNGTTTADRTWTKDGIPYVIFSEPEEETVTIAPGTTLTIDPGVIIKFAFTNSKLVVNGTLNANGTPSQPIFFTSIKDDTVGGDTNNDGAFTSPARKDWRHILINDTGTANFTHATIRYGGRFSPVAGIISEGTLSLVNSHLTQNGNSNLLVLDGTTTIFSSEIDTSSVGISHVGGSVTVSQSSIHDHTLFGVSASVPMDARNNWWGSASGPSHISNPSGSGDAVSDNVLFIPFLTSDPVGSLP